MKKKLFFLSVFLLCSILGIKMSAQDPNPNAFITKWKTPNTSIKFPGVGTNYTIVVRDLSTNTVVQTITDATSSIGTEYEVTGLTADNLYAFEVVPGVGTFTRFLTYNAKNPAFNSADSGYLLEVMQWGTISWSSMQNAFYQCINMNVTATDALELPASCNSMFYNCQSNEGNSSFNTWNTSNVTDMTRVFYNNYKFNFPLNNWDVGKVTNMTQMFRNATIFNQSLGSWNIKSVTGTRMSSMLDGSGLNYANYDATLIGWAENSEVPSGITLGAAGLKYSSAGKVAREFLVNNKEWTINDAGLDPATDNTSLSDLDTRDVAIIKYGDKLQIKNSKSIEIFNMAGVMMAHSSDSEFVSVNGIPKGIYIVRFQMSNGNRGFTKININ